MKNLIGNSSNYPRLARCLAAALLFLFPLAAQAVVSPIPDALVVQELAARQDAQALQDFLLRYQRNYESDQESERPLFQAYWALREKTDTALETFYDQWVKQSPKSYEARTVRGAYVWGRAHLIANPKAIRDVVQSDRAWQEYRQFLDKARADLEAAQTLSPHPLVAQRLLMSVCQTQGDSSCVESTYQQALAKAPRSLLLRRGYLSWVNDEAVWEKEIVEAEKQGVSAEGARVLRAEQTLHNSRKVMQADGGTEVAIHQGIVSSIQDPWLDERAAHMYIRRKNYAEAIPLYTRALQVNPNLEDALYWRGQSYFAVGDFLAAHADTMRAALIGNPQANRDLIDFHINGEKGFPKDVNAAARWCSLAAQNDQSYGAFCLGDLYANGYAGFPRDPKKSLLWTQRAAELGHQMAQHDLGVTLLKGLNGEPADRDAGIYWLKLSAEGGFQYATNKLKMHLSGWEYFKAITWPAYRDAFTSGNFSIKLVVSLLVEMMRALFG